MKQRVFYPAKLQLRQSMVFPSMYIGRRTAWLFSLISVRIINQSINNKRRQPIRPLNFRPRTVTEAGGILFQSLTITSYHQSLPETDFFLVTPASLLKRFPPTTAALGTVVSLSRCLGHLRGMIRPCDS